MIKKSFMAVVIFLTSISSFADISTTDCIFSDGNFSLNSDSTINLCKIQPTSQLETHFVLHDENHPDLSTPFHVTKKKSSLAEAITVMLFIPGLIFLLFSRFTKSAK